MQAVSLLTADDAAPAPPQPATIDATGLSIGQLEQLLVRTLYGGEATGLTLAEPDEATMALELAVRSVPSASAILEEQRGRFTNPDRKAR